MSPLVNINIAVTIIALGVSYWHNKDLFSPVKFYLLSAVMYFYDSFINTYSSFVLLSYLFFIVVALLVMPTERSYTSKFLKQVVIFRSNRKERKIYSNKILYRIVLLTSIPVGAQLYHIYLMGGIESYLLSIPLRVQLWAGLGYVIHFKTLMTVLNLFFFIVLCVFSIKNRKLWLIFFIVHTIVTVTMGFLTGSRSATLVNFLFFIMVYHYLVENIKIHYIVIFIAILFPLSSLLGFFRQASFMNQLSENAVEISQDDLESTLYRENSVSYKVAIFPLEILEEKHYDDLCYGSTYLSALTNFIPRALWPEKLSSGGTILTNFGLGNASNESLTTAYSTGAIAEGIINFGYYFGYIFAFIQIFLFFYIIFWSFSFTTIHLLKNQLKKILWGIFLIITTIQLPGSSIGGEFTNAIFNILLRLFLGYFCFRLLFYRISLNANKY